MKTDGIFITRPHRIFWGNCSELRALCLFLSVGSKLFQQLTCKSYSVEELNRYVEGALLLRKATPSVVLELGCGMDEGGLSWLFLPLGGEFHCTGPSCRRHGWVKALPPWVCWGGGKQVHCHAEWRGPSGHGCNWLRQSYPRTFRPALSLLAPAHGSGLWPQNCLCIWGAAFSPTLAIEEVIPGADTMQGVSHTRVKIWLSIPGREGTKASSYPRLFTPFGAKKEKRWNSHCSQLDFPLTPLPVSQPLPQVLSLITL